jgi:glycosyltransferase involved in cell wall biosynthesis
MRIVLISEVFSKNMGYLENLLPKYLARQGAQVDVVASSLPPDYRNQTMESSYRGFADGWRAGTYDLADGFRLHILPPVKQSGYIRLAGLDKKLRDLQPGIVQTMTPIGWIAVDASWNQLILRYRLFSGCHYHASVFPLAHKSFSMLNIDRLKCLLQRGIPGRIASLTTEKYYAISQDCAEIAMKFFGVPGGKIALSPLGIDTEVFHPISSAAEESACAQLRAKYGFSNDEIVCIYTGRFSEDKNPLVLAKAVSRLVAKGHPFKALFVGNGPQAAEIEKCPGCFQHPFVPVNELGDLYRAADIAVWPTQESMSMLDAAACGLPVVANDELQARERLDGNGMTYRLLDLEDLETVLLHLKNKELRRKLGTSGAEKMARYYSWHAIACERLRDYETALARPRFLRQARDVSMS